MSNLSARSTTWRTTIRSSQASAAGWDIVEVDEAHHLEWTPEYSNEQYDLVSDLSRGVGLLLLTATPTQLGVAEFRQIAFTRSGPL